MELKSSVFNEGKSIPSLYTCDGKDISPPLEWSGEPDNTKTFALIADDPDAPMGTWVHWVIFNIPSSTHVLSEGIERKKQLSDGSIQGVNDFKRPGYGGPCPPSGTHRYFFKLYALDSELSLGPDAVKKDLENAMKGHVLAEAQCMGTYAR
jgi:hypothetical protein